MATYAELKAQAEALLLQAEQVRKQELNNVILGIKATMKEHGITLEDLGAAARKAGARAKAPAKFKGPNGETWSGGPGRKPEWVRALQAEGKNIENYRI